MLQHLLLWHLLYIAGVIVTVVLGVIADVKFLSWVSSSLGDVKIDVDVAADVFLMLLLMSWLLSHPWCHP